MSRKPWYKVNQELFQTLQKQIQYAYPELQFSVRNNTVFLTGNFILRDGDKVVDSFLIEIEFPFNYPKRIPVVYEIEGRIPRIADRHTYPSGECCLYLPLQLSDVFPEGSGLLDFLDSPVRSFFVSQSYFELTGEWPFGVWPHGEAAIIEFYAPILGTTDRKMISRYFEMISKKEIKGHWLCPCGSGKILRQCHYEMVSKLHRDYQYAISQTGRRDRKREPDSDG
jgi:hypothetical protein